MKEERGFTLVELMVVVSITVLLLAWGVPSYSTWKKKHDIENQMVQLYSDLQFGRMTAYGRKVVAGVYWGTGASIPTTTPYQIRYDANANNSIEDTGTDVQIGAAVTLKYPITISANQNGVSVTQNSASFDGRGFLNYTGYPADPATQIIFSVSSSYGAAMDCVNVTSTKITLGKMNAGICLPK
ncbi:MAG: prepilin-type N-terminal cleavage/methylation domain-containing protein [Syntrophobacteraceae bacterium]